MLSTQKPSRVVAAALVFVMVIGCAACKPKPAAGESQQGSNTSADTHSTGDISDTESTESEESDMTSNTDNTSSTTGTSSKSSTVSTASSAASGTVSTASSAPSTTSTTSNPVSNAEISYYQEIISTECAWLAGMQLPNGALPQTYSASGTLSVNPYFSDFAALGLLEGDSKYLTNVKKYMDWHFSHLNTKDYNGVNGTIYDYTVTVMRGNVTKEEITYKNGKPLYDSTDSYAATFLSVLNRYYEKSGDKSYIQSNYDDIKRVINALFATMRDGLTLAKPDYAVKYLMDNAEVYKGLDDTVKLLSTALSGYGDAATQLAKIKSARDTLKSKIESQMWNKAGYYEAALSEDSVVSWDFSWDEFYPSATANIALISGGVLTPDSARGKQIYKSFNDHFATGRDKYDWPTMTNGDTFYWCTVVHTAAIMDDRDNVKKFMDLYKKFVMKKHAYPLYNAEAGHAIRAAAQMIENLSK